MLGLNKTSCKRNFRVKLLIVALLLLLFASLMIACNVTQQGTESNNNIDERLSNSTEQSLGKPLGKAVDAPVLAIYVHENEITIDVIEDFSNTSHQRTYFQISGLADQEIQDKINNEIKAFYNKLLKYANGEEVVPYRGAAVIAGIEPIIDHSYLYISPTFNYNNVLSIAGHVSGSYVNPKRHDTYFTVMDGLNFDLSSGEQFYLNTVFADNSDYKAVVNQYVVDAIRDSSLRAEHDYMGYENSMQLVAPFISINDRQAFYLTDNGVSVIIDHRNPEFTMGMSGANVSVPYQLSGGEIAITERFKDEFPLSERKRFLNNYEQKIVREQMVEERENGSWIRTIAHPSFAPQHIVDVLEGKHQQLFAAVLAENSEVDINFIEQNTYSYRVGNFYNIDVNLFYVIGESGVWEETRSVYHHSGREVKLAELFVNSYDYEKLIKERIVRAIKEYGLDIDVNDQAVVDYLYEGSSFTINDTMLAIITAKIREDMADDFNHSIYFTIDYSDFGFDNLLVFDLE